MPFEALDEPARLGRGKGRIERGWLVGVEIVLHQNDFHCGGDSSARNIPHRTGIMDRGGGACPAPKSPTLPRLEHHVARGGVISLGFVIPTRPSGSLRRG